MQSRRYSQQSALHADCTHPNGDWYGTHVNTDANPNKYANPDVSAGSMRALGQGVFESMIVFPVTSCSTNECVNLVPAYAKL